MRKIILLFAVILSGCATGNNSILTKVDCKSGKAIYHEQNHILGSTYKFENTISFVGDVLVSETGKSGNVERKYYIHPSVPFIIYEHIGKSDKQQDIYLMDSQNMGKEILSVNFLNSQDRFRNLSFNDFYKLNKQNYALICGSEKISEISKAQDISGMSNYAGKLLSYRTVDGAGREHSDPEYFRYQEYNNILKKYFPEYIDNSDVRISVSDPVALLSYFVKNKDKLLALETELENYFTELQLKGVGK